MSHIVVLLPHDRDRVGTLTLYDDSGRIIAGPFTALGLADKKDAERHNNIERDALKQYGNTPLGEYSVAGFLPYKDQDDRTRHGPNGKIVLQASSGQALEADRQGNRKYLEIHGGTLRGYQLRPTNGCIRVSDDDMKQLMLAILFENRAPTSCKIDTLMVSVWDVNQERGAEAGGGDVDPVSINKKDLLTLPAFMKFSDTSSETTPTKDSPHQAAQPPTKPQASTPKSTIPTIDHPPMERSGTKPATGEAHPGPAKSGDGNLGNMTGDPGKLP